MYDELTRIENIYGSVAEYNRNREEKEEKHSDEENIVPWDEFFGDYVEQEIPDIMKLAFKE